MLKTIIFDFDGTLTKNSVNGWKVFWGICGCDFKESSRYNQLFQSYLSGKITHDSWVKLTANVFISKGINVTHLDEVVSGQNVVEDFREVVDFLIEKDFKLHILSGGFKQAIEKTLKDYLIHFDSVNANSLVFDEKGYLKDIIGTPYDFEGKKVFVDKLIKSGVSATDIYFVGNDINDEWVCKTGCHTICINPDMTDKDNKEVWSGYIENLSDLKSLV